MKRSEMATPKQAPESLGEKAMYVVGTVFLLSFPAFIWLESLIEGM
jgi:hypothetical protein